MWSKETFCCKGKVSGRGRRLVRVPIRYIGRASSGRQSLVIAKGRQARARLLLKRFSPWNLPAPYESVFSKRIQNTVVYIETSRKFTRLSRLVLRVWSSNLDYCLLSEDTTFPIVHSLTQSLQTAPSQSLINCLSQTSPFLAQFVQTLLSACRPVASHRKRHHTGSLTRLSTEKRHHGLRTHVRSKAVGGHRRDARP